uniref:Uncharacterized protein n=1 Tax=Rhizophora mucronata TaxID=61149 RepID=A0A2P2NZM1_RHIMU
MYQMLGGISLGINAGVGDGIAVRMPFTTNPFCVWLLVISKGL